MAYNPYANAKAKAVETYSPGELVVALYDGAILNLNKAKMYIDEKDVAKASEMLTKSQKIIRHLNASLDMAYPISQELRRLYTFFDEQIIMSNLRKNEKSIEVIDELLPMLEDLKSSFAQADRISRQQAAQ